ncbi:hypothetical protein [Caulobacter sp. 17J80-11]|uniref:hypothetical protein n=1 Tax=Caulobacter sp. 17J80-11 TaxID=2763502 RepID=UPI0016538324|nr:hypothetical protein [Caulobacter sp. 17J80-11]MBC6980722.1 hypothetical protein [Caulobacter sp. 17J80-11]
MIRRLLIAAQIAAAAALLLWPALIAGRPAVFDDTDGYYWLGESLSEAGLQSLLHLFGDHRPIIAQGSLFAPDGVQYLSYMGARSPAYALFLFLTQRLGSLWFTVYLQALAAAWMIRTLLRAAVPRAGAKAFFGLIAGLSATTALPFYAGFAMPDLFAGLAALALVLLLVFPDRLPRASAVAVWLILALALSFHRSNLLVALAVLGVVFAVLAWRRGPRRSLRRCAVAASAAAAALAALTAYPALIRALPGPAELADPPFLMARVLADGPGRAYLAHACAHRADYALCDFQHVAMTDSEDILWSQEPGYALVETADAATRARLKAEERTFVLATLKSAPLAELGAALRNVGLQLIRFQVAEPLESPAQYVARGQNAIATILPGAEACQQEPACTPPFHAGFLRWLHSGIVVLGAGFLAVWAVRARTSAPAGDEARLLYAAALIVGFLVLNAALCGVLSAPMPRYQARVIWLLPLLAGVVAIASARGWRSLATTVGTAAQSTAVGLLAVAFYRR